MRSPCLSAVILSGSLLLPVEVPAHDPPPGCTFIGHFTSLEDWDAPAPNAGLDLGACGLDAVADTGTVTAGGASIVLTPGARDDLGLGQPIAIAGLASEPSLAAGAGDYRVRFRFIAHPGLTTAAFFVRVRYAFDEATGTIDASTFAALGVNFTFDSLGHDVISDHLHSDVRGPCLSTIDASPEAVNYPGFLMNTRAEWSMVIDVAGDDESGPVGLALKLHAAADPEPTEPFAVFRLERGFGPDPGDENRHAFLAAALGAGALEITEITLCEIPDGERRVQDLECVREDGGSVRLTWRNPASADLLAPIHIFVGGVEEAVVNGDATEHILEGVPEGTVVISVVNASGAPAACTPSGSPEGAHFLRGDCNAGGTIDISDAIFHLNFLFSAGSVPGCVDACNTNGDGQGDISDPIYTLAFLFSGGPPPGEPHPGCSHGGVELGCEVEHCPH